MARSRELPGVFALAGVAGATALMASTSITHWTSFYRNTLYAASTGNIDSNGPLFFWSAIEVMRWIVPILLRRMMSRRSPEWLQAASTLLPEALALKFDRFNPASRLGQISPPSASATR